MYVIGIEINVQYNTTHHGGRASGKRGMITPLLGFVPPPPRPSLSTTIYPKGRKERKRGRAKTKKQKKGGGGRLYCGNFGQIKRMKNLGATLSSYIRPHVMTTDR